MATFKTLLVGAAVGALIAVTGIAAAARVLNPPTAQEVATRISQEQGTGTADPLAPPDSYGSR